MLNLYCSISVAMAFFPRHRTLDKDIVLQSKIPQFTTAGLMDYLVELIVTDDKVCQLQSLIQ